MVRARLPAAAGSGQPDTIVRTAFLRFGAGPAAELTMHAQADDQGAEGEFRRLLETAKPAATSDPVREVARAVEAGPVGRPGHPAGPILLELTPDYHGPGSFTLTSDDRTARVRLEEVAAGEKGPAIRAAVEGTILGAGVGVALDEEGRPLRYEAGVRPKLYSRRKGIPEIAVTPEAHVRGAEAQGALPGEVVMEGVVRGKNVRLRLERASDNPKFDPKALGEETLRALNEPD